MLTTTLLKQRNTVIQNDRTLSASAKKARIAENMRWIRLLEALAPKTDNYSNILRDK